MTLPPGSTFNSKNSLKHNLDVSLPTDRKHAIDKDIVWLRRCGFMTAQLQDI